MGHLTFDIEEGNSTCSTRPYGADSQNCRADYWSDSLSSSPVPGVRYLGIYSFITGRNHLLDRPLLCKEDGCSETPCQRTRAPQSSLKFTRFWIACTWRRDRQ